MQIDISTAIAVAAVVISLVFGLINNRRAKTDDVQYDTTQIVTVICKLDSIAESISELKSDLRNVKGEVSEVSSRLAVCEHETKVLDKRINDLLKFIPSSSLTTEGQQ